MRAKLSHFIAFQFLRSPSERRRVSEIGDFFLNSWAKDFCADRHRVANALERYQAETGGETLTPEIFMDLILSQKVLLKTTEKPFLQALLSNVNYLSFWIYNLNWKLLCAPASSQFVFCDEPLTIIPPQNDKNPQIGIAVPGNEILFPLSASFCLRMIQGELDFTSVPLSSTEVRVANCNTAANSERYIMASDRNHLESVVKRSRSQNQAAKRSSVGAIDLGAGELLFQTIAPRIYFY
jgi:hypothetical protein